MHCSTLCRWMMHSAWTGLKEITAERDKGKVVDKSPNLSNHMQPCWPHIKTNCLLFSPSTSCPYWLPCGEENTLLKETDNKSAPFSALLFPLFFHGYWFAYADFEVDWMRVSCANLMCFSQRRCLLFWRGANCFCCDRQAVVWNPAAASSISKL